MKHIFQVVFLLICLTSHGNIRHINSPNGKITIEFSNIPGLSYRILENGQAVVDHSAIRMEFEGGIRIGHHCKMLRTSSKSYDETWTPVVPSRRSTIRNNYNELYIEYKETGNGMVFGIRARVYDDGAAFRYEFLQQVGFEHFMLMDESTQFRFTKNWDDKCWAANHGKFAGPQQTHYPERRMKELPENGLFGLPFVIQQKARFVVLAEAALVDYSGMFLREVQSTEGRLTGTTLQTILARPSADEYGAVVRKESFPHQSPWRMVMIAKNPADFYSNDMLLNLNEPCAIEDPSWIKPGVSAWDHWWTGGVKMNTKTIKEYIDLAAEMGWEYQLIDWQWYGKYNTPNADITTVNPDVDMKEVRSYAEKKNVKLWLWLYWRDVHNQDAYLNAFPLYKKWGIAGVKIDFMDREDQWMVNWYHKIVKAAAENQLMVDFHGAYKPTGWRRTYPNLMTREGVEGNEEYKWSTDINPEQKCVVAFTRNLLGEMDFTPGGFINKTEEDFQTKVNPTQVMGTRCQELALFVVYDSPYMCACDHPDNYRGQSGTDFLKIVPTTWDETIGIDGEIGEYITLAKRKGQEWYVAAMTNWEERQKEVELDFLDEGKKYTATIWRDADDANEFPQRLVKEEKPVIRGDKLRVKLAKGGGAVIRIK